MEKSAVFLGDYISSTYVIIWGRIKITNFSFQTDVTVTKFYRVVKACAMNLLRHIKYWWLGPPPSPSTHLKREYPYPLPTSLCSI